MKKLKRLFASFQTRLGAEGFLHQYHIHIVEHAMKQVLPPIPHTIICTPQRCVIRFHGFMRMGRRRGVNRWATPFTNRKPGIGLVFYMRLK